MHMQTQLQNILAKMETDRQWIDNVRSVVRHYQAKVASVKLGLRQAAQGALAIKHSILRKNQFNRQQVGDVHHSVVEHAYAGLLKREGVTMIRSLCACVDNHIVAYMNLVPAAGVVTGSEAAHERGQGSAGLPATHRLQGERAPGMVCILARTLPGARGWCYHCHQCRLLGVHITAISPLLLGVSSPLVQSLTGCAVLSVVRIPSPVSGLVSSAASSRSRMRSSDCSRRPLFPSRSRGALYSCVASQLVLMIIIHHTSSLADGGDRLSTGPAQYEYIQYGCILQAACAVKQVHLSFSY